MIESSGISCIKSYEVKMVKACGVLEVIPSGNAPYLDFLSRVKQATITTLWLASYV